MKIAIVSTVEWEDKQTYKAFWNSLVKHVGSTVVFQRSVKRLTNKTFYVCVELGAGYFG